MRSVLLLALSLFLQAPMPTRPLDVSTLVIGTPVTVADIDTGKLKGALRQLAWSPDLTQFYLQTTDSDGPGGTVRHYLAAADGGAVVPAPSEPDWAIDYWRFKSDRYAPGLPSLVIGVDQKMEVMKVGTGSAGAIEGGNRAGGDTVMSANNIDREAQNQKQNVTRLTLLDETISEFVNQRVIPGLTFVWGPSGSGAIVFADSEGRLVFLDQHKHKRVMIGSKDAVLPAWTTDGTRVAFLQKAGRKKYHLVTVTIAPPPG
jgi:hypothetical protein